MNFFGIGNRVFQEHIRILVNRQEETTKLQLVFPAYPQYKSNPTFQQMEELVDIVEKLGYRTNDLYHIFSSGKIPNWLDTIIRELSVKWKC